jgi:BioD-like phosphotransacetylase family protein
MPELTICSPRLGDGKTTVAVGLLSLLGRAGLSGYRRLGADGADAAFVQAAFGLASSGHSAGLIEADAPLGQTLVVAAYRGAGTVAEARGCAGSGAIGAILTQVPAAQVRYVERELRPALAAAGLPLLGALPEERALRSHTAAELAAYLDGNVLTARESLANPIESYMIGAMSHIGASGVPYFERMETKVVVTGGDRIDVHLAALGTLCQAMVLTGGYHPDPVVIERAEAEECPLIQVGEDTPEVVDRISQFLRKVRCRHAAKVPIAARLVEQCVDLAPIEAALGVRRAAAA